MKPHLFSLSTQIWKHLPHLKAVVIYREAPPMRMPSVYTVRVGGLGGSGGLCEPTQLTGTAPTLPPGADGGAHGAGE